MDLLELDTLPGTRHPWETVRAKILRKILHDRRGDGKIARVLDVGCGDGFTIKEVCLGMPLEAIDAVDTNLTQDQIAAWSDAAGCPSYHADYSCLRHHGYQLITLFDVLEHVADDAAFLVEIIAQFAAVPDAKIFITVPAFNCLSSSHDTYLQHRRRYNPAMMHKLATEAGVHIEEYGFLFSALLPARTLTLLWEKLTPRRKPSFRGVGQWRRGRTITWLIGAILYMDCWVALQISRLGVRLPGLTLWFICTPR